MLPILVPISMNSRSYLESLLPFLCPKSQPCTWFPIWQAPSPSLCPSNRLLLPSPLTATAPLPGPQDFLHPLQYRCLPALLLSTPSAPSLFHMPPGAFQFSPLSTSSKTSPCFILSSNSLYGAHQSSSLASLYFPLPFSSPLSLTSFPLSQAWANTKRTEKINFTGQGTFLQESVWGRDWKTGSLYPKRMKSWEC